MLRLQEILCKNWQQQQVDGQLRNESIRLVLREMQAYLQEISKSADVLDNKMRSFSLLSGWLAFAASLFMQSSPMFSALGPWIIAIIVVYGMVVLAVLDGQQPHSYRFPLTLEWEKLDTRFFRESEQSAMLALISDYIATIEENKTILAVKTRRYQRLLRVSEVLLGLILIATLYVVLTGGK